MCPTWMGCVSQNEFQRLCVEHTGLFQNVAQILRLGRGLSIGFPTMDVACLCRAVSVPKLIGSLFAFGKRVNIKRYVEDCAAM